MPKKRLVSDISDTLLHLRYLHLLCQSDVIKKLQRTEPCSNSSWRESQKVLKGTRGSCLDKRLWIAEEISHEHMPSHAFLSLLDSVSSLMFVSSYQNHLMLSCSPLLMPFFSAQHQEQVSWEHEWYRSFYFCSSCWRIYPWLHEEPQQRKYMFPYPAEISIWMKSSKWVVHSLLQISSAGLYMPSWNNFKIPFG